MKVSAVFVLLTGGWIESAISLCFQEESGRSKRRKKICEQYGMLRSPQ